MIENYKMILVDDEDDVRGRLISKIKDDSGFTVVGKAGNGYDALELIEKHRPHVVLTDIKMPFIDGIELARIIRRDYPTTKVAFISGYDEFDYARQAIELNVLSYLMKPVTSGELDVFLSKLKKSLDEEIDSITNTEKLKDNYNHSLPLLIDAHLNSILLKQELTKEDFDKLSTYGLEIGKGNYITCYIGAERKGSTFFEETGKTKIFLKNLIDKVFSSYDFKYQLLVSDGIILTVRDEKNNISKEIDLELFEIIKYAEQYGNADIQIGVSKMFNDFRDFPKSFKESNEALGYSNYYNTGRIIYFGEIEKKEKKHIVIDEAVMSDLEYQMKYGSKEAIEESLLKLQEFTKNDNQDIILDHQLLVINLANSIINFSNSVNVSLRDAFDGNILEKLLSYSNSEDLFGWIKDIIFKLRDLNIKSHTNKTEQIIQNAVKYINSNYSDLNVSLESVSDYLNISVSYLSMLFSKNQKISFNKYLVKVRMEKAKELLKFTKDKVINISRLVGYNEVYYFSHSFKKYTGVSPKEFRANV